MESSKGIGDAVRRELRNLQEAVAELRVQTGTEALELRARVRELERRLDEIAASESAIRDRCRSPADGAAGTSTRARGIGQAAEGTSTRAEEDEVGRRDRESGRPGSELRPVVLGRFPSRAEEAIGRALRQPSARGDATAWISLS